MGQVMTVEELRALLLDKDLIKDLPLSKSMLDYIVNLVSDQSKTINESKHLMEFN